MFLGSRIIFSLNQAVQPLVDSSRLFVHPPYKEAVSSNRRATTWQQETLLTTEAATKPLSIRKHINSYWINAETVKQLWRTSLLIDASFLRIRTIFFIWYTVIKYTNAWLMEVPAALEGQAVAQILLHSLYYTIRITKLNLRRLKVNTQIYYIMYI